MDKVKRVLVVCWLSGRCRPFVNYAISEARNYKAELYIVHIIHDPFGIEGWNVPHASLQKDFEKLVGKIKKDMEELVAEGREQGLKVKEFIREGKPVDEIEKVVREEKIDLLVLPAHEESRLEHFLFGRDNEELIRSMPCSILLVKKEPGPAPYPWQSWAERITAP